MGSKMRVQFGLVLSNFGTFAHFLSGEAAALHDRRVDLHVHCCEITIEELDLSFRGFHVCRHLTVHLHSLSTSQLQVEPRCQPVRKTMLNDETIAES